MTNVTIKVELPKGFMSAASNGLTSPLRTASLALGKEIKSEIAPAPGPSAQPVRWASDAQRAWYRAARAGAGLPMKYTRISDPWSERLEDKWTVRRMGRIGAVTANPVSYGPFVHAADKQTAQHQATGWVTDEEAAEAVVASGAAEKIYVTSIENYLSG